MVRVTGLLTFMFAAVVGFSAGCADENGSGLFSPPQWKMVLHFEGAELEFPLEVMNVFLVEDHAYPETYEMIGPDVTLVGEFPLDVHVDYGEDWKKLIGVTVTISPSYDLGREIKQSTITLANGTTLKVVDGTFTPKEFTGKYAGSEGDMTLTGVITVTVQTPASGEQTLEGTFSVHAVSWG